MKKIVKAALTGAATAAIGFVILSALLPTPAKAFDIPFDWSCDAAGTSCRAPGLQPRAKKFPSEFHGKFHYPHEIVVENKADFNTVAKGWTKKGDCSKFIGSSDMPEVDYAKAKYCLFWQKGYAAPVPKIVKGW